METEARDDIRTRKVKQDLPVELTRKEVEEYGKELAAWEVALGNEKEAKALAAGQSNAIIKELSAQIAERAEILDSGRETREVECQETADYAARTISIMRLDTYEIIRSRDMKEGESQKDLW